MNLRLFTLILFLFSFSFQSESQNLIPREEFFQEKEKFKVRLSNKGDFVFFQKEKEGLDGSLYTLRTDVVAQPSQLILGEKLLDWTQAYSGEIIAVVENGDKKELVKTPIRSKKAKPIEWKAFKSLKFLARSPKFANKMVVEIEGVDEKDSGRYILDIINGNSKRLPGRLPYDKLFLDDFFTPIAAMSENADGGNTLFWKNDTQWDTIANHSKAWDMYFGGFNQILSVSQDGSKIYYTDNTNQDKTALFELNRTTGEQKELAKSEKADILPFGFSYDPKGNITSAIALFADSERHFLDQKVKDDFEVLRVKLGNVKWVGSSEDQETWLVGTMNGGPIEYYIFKRKELKLNRLFDDYSYFERYELATRKAHTVAGRDDISLPVHVYLPYRTDEDGDGIPNKTLPTIIYVHGGPWVGLRQWNQWSYLRQFQLMANRGYAVVVAEFRGTTGLGKRVHELGAQQWGEKMHLDIVDISDWAIKKGIADPRKVGLLGWSYGGYAAAAGVAFTPKAFSCAVSMFGPTDLTDFVKNYRNSERWHKMVGDPSTPEGEELLKKHSPMNVVDQINAPVLLTTGSQDEQVPQAQIDAFANKLKGANKEVIYFNYPEEGHTFLDVGSWVSFWAITEAFLEEYLGGRSEDRNDAIEQGNMKVILGGDFIEKIE